MLTERREKVLILEDNPTHRFVSRDALSSGNFWIMEANRLHDLDPVPYGAADNQSISSLERLVGSHFFHATIIDLSFRKDDDNDRQGMEALSKINRFREGTESVVSSAYGTASVVRDLWKKRGAYDFLSKNEYTDEQLLSVIRDAVSQAKTHLNANITTRYSYYDLVDSRLREAASNRLTVGSNEEIRSVVEDIMRPYFPFDLVRRRASFEEIHASDEKSFDVLYIELWSRYLGGVVELRVGSQVACDFRANSWAAGGLQKGSQFEIVESGSREKLVGLLRYIPYDTIDDFMPPPPEANEEA